MRGCRRSSRACLEADTRAAFVTGRCRRRRGVMPAARTHLHSSVTFATRTHLHSSSLSPRARICIRPSPSSRARICTGPSPSPCARVCTLPHLRRAHAFALVRHLRHARSEALRYPHHARILVREHDSRRIRPRTTPPLISHAHMSASPVSFGTRTQVSASASFVRIEPLPSASPHAT